MDLIYRNSEATIITAAGEDPSYGLPGVGDCHRRRQFRFQIGKRCFVGPMRFMDKVVDGSRWGTRGWTFQEGRLSRRRLVFTDDQVYFECRGMYCYESMDIPLEKFHGESLQEFGARYMKNSWIYERRIRVFQPNERVGWYIYDQIQDYSERNFTKPSDRLNGFLGMLNYINAIHGFRHLWGMPIPPDKGFVKNRRVLPFYEPHYSNTSFVKGLFFHHASQSPDRVTRIPIFPSWSWLGWDGGVLYPLYLKGEGHYSPLEVGVSIELKNGQLLDLCDFHERYAELNDYSQLTHFLHISAPVALAYVVTEDRTPEGYLQCIFRLDNGCHLPTTLEDVIDCRGGLLFGIIWANYGHAALVILTRMVRDGFKRVGMINCLRSKDSDELLTSDYVFICNGDRILSYFEGEFWTHLETENMTLRLI